MVGFMGELLLEICSSEIPAGMQQNALKRFCDLLSEELKLISPNHKLQDSWVTPRRMGVLFDGVSLSGINKQEIRGPQIGASESAIAGFLQKNKVRLDDLIKKDGYYFYFKELAHVPIEMLLSSAITNVLSKMVWPKSMMEGSSLLRWVRPMQSILCLLDAKVIEFEYYHIKSSNQTSGHRFMGAENIAITSYKDYLEKMHANNVILSANDRKNMILHSIDTLMPSGASLIADSGLLEEICGLVEYPYVIMGHIDEKYMSLPKEVLVLTLKYHQRYMMSEYADNRLLSKLAPYYFIVCNIRPTDNGASILQGNTKVLNARLEDAAFFFSQDTKVSIDELSKKADKIIYHEKIGDIEVKKIKSIEIARKICDCLHVSCDDIIDALKLAKADLSSVLVREFPELQGKMGGYYAHISGYNSQVAEAITEHYKPQGPNDSLPTSVTAAIVAISDKLSTLHLLFSIGIKPTGSKDPYALRRAALGIWRIVDHFNLALSFKEMDINDEAIDFLYDKR